MAKVRIEMKPQKQILSQCFDCEKQKKLFVFQLIININFRLISYKI